MDYIPLWGLFVITLAIVGLSVEAGYRIGRYRRRRSDQEKEAPVGAIVASTLGLLAFMLAFTFNLAAARFDARRQLVVEESNAIGTSYLRAGLLPEPNRGEIRKLYRQYVDARLQPLEPAAVEKALAKTADLQRALWSEATAVAGQDSRSIVAGLFIQSLNEVIDLQSKRGLFALHSRIPGLVWWTLYFIAGLSMAALGYQEGLSGSRRSLAGVALALCFAAVILLIADLDRPHQGLLRVSQRSLADLQSSLDAYDSITDSGAAP